MEALITGISGYVGDLLARRLLDGEAATVRGLARDPSKVRLDVPVVRGDLSTGEGLAEAMEGVGVAYYLVHSMEGDVDFVDQELRQAARFAEAAEAAGVRRIVYMGVLTPPGSPDAWSPHVRSRMEVEEALAARGAELVALRASIVIGAGSRSFRFLLGLVERMPVLPLPPWRANRTSPIDERDLIAALVRALDEPASGHRVSWDAVGPDVVRYEDLIRSIADHLMVSRPILPFPLKLDAVTAPVAAAISGEDPGLVAPLIGSLGSDLLARDPAPDEIDLGRPSRSVDTAVEHALRDLDRQDRDR